MTQHTLLLDDTLYYLTPTKNAFQWVCVYGNHVIGSVFLTQDEALKWINLMLKYEWSGRGSVFLRVTAESETR